MTHEILAFASSGDPAEILNWRRFNARLTTSGQPTLIQLAKLGELGVTHVINLGPNSHENALPDERRALAALDIDYTYIPVDFSAPAEADFQRFRTAMADAEDAVLHIHCIYNARVTAFLYRDSIDGPDTPLAASIMESVWRPGGVWAQFIGKGDRAQEPHRYAGRDY
ncbi:protein tyrosine phosphatase family protein [Devosia sp. Naph2]|uniref:protein tyrosine phosphatase family protein n=1 Tax=Devosia polycyclovorans TaxID=3345148 RepID=UPI0035D0CD95